MNDAPYSPGDLVRILEKDNYFDSDILQYHPELIGEIIKVDRCLFDADLGHWDVWIAMDDFLDVWIAASCVELVFSV